MKNIVFVLILASFVCLSIQQNNWDFKWTSCASANDGFQVTNVTMPDDPTRGKNVTVYTTGNQIETVSGGNWTTKVYLGFLLVDTFQGSVCSLSGIHCPSAPGIYTFAQSFPIPIYAPDGGYSGKYVAYDQNGKELGCVNYTFNCCG